MTSSFPPADSILRSLSDILSDDDRCYSSENPRKFSGYAKRLQTVLNQLLRSSPAAEDLPASVQTSLRGIDGDLKKAAETMAVYGKKSKIYVLIYCDKLCESLREVCVAVGGWLALLDTAVVEIVPELHKKIVDLSTDMKQAQFKVTHLFIYLLFCCISFIDNFCC